MSMAAPVTPQTLYADRLESAIGTLLLIHDREGHVRALDFHDFEPRMRRLLRLHYGAEGDDFAIEDRAAPMAIRRAISDYFLGDLCAIDSIPVTTGGTSFQREVWAALRTIQAGTTLSYGALARQLGRPKSVRAVGLANAANPVAIVVPCHRVIGADGSLTGYGGGISRKRWLLVHEGSLWRSLPRDVFQKRHESPKQRRCSANELAETPRRHGDPAMARQVIEKAEAFQKMNRKREGFHP
jgi:methylated-DNA-[protein]-cysteine S-methyltransferase